MPYIVADNYKIILQVLLSNIMWLLPWTFYKPLHCADALYHTQWSSIVQIQNL